MGAKMSSQVKRTPTSKPLLSDQFRIDEAGVDNRCTRKKGMLNNKILKLKGQIEKNDKICAQAKSALKSRFEAAAAEITRQHNALEEERKLSETTEAVVGEGFGVRKRKLNTKKRTVFGVRKRKLSTKKRTAFGIRKSGPNKGTLKKGYRFNRYGRVVKAIKK